MEKTMSYDANIGEESFNITYNVSKMFYDCYPSNGIKYINGTSGNLAVMILRNLREHMENNADRMRAMEPSNGWGSYKGALEFISELIVASLDNPDDVWSII